MRKRWNVELNRKNNSVSIYSGDNELIASVKEKEFGRLVDTMRDEIIKQIRNRFGEGYGHELHVSKEIGDGIFEIPVIVYKTHIEEVSNPKRFIDKVKTGFTSILPASAGYYWIKKAEKEPTIVEVIYSMDNYYVVVPGESSRIDLLKFHKKEGEPLWSSSKIPLPIVEHKEEATVDTEEW